MRAARSLTGRTRAEYGTARAEDGKGGGRRAFGAISPGIFGRLISTRMQPLPCMLHEIWYCIR